MTPFTKQEMIRVAKAAGVHCGTRLKSYAKYGSTSTIYTWGHESMSYDVSSDMFELANTFEGEAIPFNIIMVTDTIKQILEERKQAGE